MNRIFKHLIHTCLFNLMSDNIMWVDEDLDTS